MKEKAEELKVFISHRASVCGECHEELGRQRERAALRRAELDEEFVARFATRVRELFPGLPEGREASIAEHACEKYSGRVGRSAAARSLGDEAVGLAVVAHIRHRETAYDELLAAGEDREVARSRVRKEVETALERWSRPSRP